MFAIYCDRTSGLLRTLLVTTSLTSHFVPSEMEMIRMQGQKHEVIVPIRQHVTERWGDSHAFFFSLLLLYLVGNYVS